MMRIEHVKPINRKNGRIALIAVLIAALLSTVVAALFFRVPAAHAETGGSVTVHVYDSQMQYSSLGGWFWIKGGASGKEYKISSAPADDEAFSKTYTDGGKEITNKAYTFTIPLTEAHVGQLKSGMPFGLLICKAKGNGTAIDFWDRFEKETPDVFTDLSKVLDANNNAHIYYVRTDTVSYTDIEEAKKALEKITSARFTEKTNSSVTVEFEATSPLTTGAAVTISVGEDDVATSTVVADPENSFKGSATFTKLNSNNFDFTADYFLTVKGVPNGTAITKTILIDDVDFIKTFEGQDTQDQKYGAIYSKESTTFTVWAPFASAASVKLYNDGTGGEVIDIIEMEKHMPPSGNWGGVWKLTLEGDHKGEFYNYIINNYGAETEATDPYAKACGANGVRGMIVDLADTNPVGWTNDKHLYNTNPTAADTPIVWEIAVPDFSSSPDSGMKYKGKYLAFTEQNTTVPGNSSLKTGVNYLKDLGITYIHLNPVYDFSSVDETATTIADNTSAAFNWGYDPQNYNIPEGSYSTDPTDGITRIKEFKQMVMALHNAGIGVIMDVVYNHTYSTGGQALHDTVPYYYHRTDENGNLTDAAGCGNETASERTMMRKYMVESIKYWATEYHIDGFRFDLMGIHDVTTLQTIRNELDALDGGKGTKLLMYGEPWAADGSYIPPSYTNRVSATRSGVTGYALNPSSNVLVKNLFAGYNNDYPRDMTSLPERVAVFNDSSREGLRGNNDPGNGWANYNVGGKGHVMRLLEGGCGGAGAKDGMKTGNGARNVAYAAAHDNFTLWDQISGGKSWSKSPLAYENAISDNVKRCKLVASVYLMSPGISFMLAGEEMGRTKYGNENSYNSPTKLNQIVWTRQVDFSSLYNHYKSLIALRKKYSSQLFSYAKCAVASFCTGNFSNENDTTGAFTFTRTQNGITLTMTLNPTALTGGIKVGSDPTLSF